MASLGRRKSGSQQQPEGNNNNNAKTDKALTQAELCGTLAGDNKSAPIATGTPREPKSDPDLKPTLVSETATGESVASKPADRKCEDVSRGQSSGTPGGQQRQMFNLKQLALNSRNLTIRKRNSQEQQDVARTGSSQTGATLPEVGRSIEHSAGSSGDNSCTSEGEQQPPSVNVAAGSAREESGCEPDGSSLSAIEPAGRDDTGDDEEENLVVESAKARSESSREDLLESVDEDELEGDDHDVDYNDQDDDDDDCEDEDEDDDDNDDEEDVDDDEDDDESMSSDDAKGKDRLRLRRRKRRQLSRRRRSSCCQCEPIVSRLDPLDGLPVTDVDLVTYKDLCQLEQQSLHMRTNQRRQRVSGGGQHQHHHHHHNHHRQELALANKSRQAGVAAIQLRRASLQEESSAYYQLCTSSEEQAIRQRYVWYPPSLGQPALVDQFFANFPREKVPFVKQQQASTGPAASSTSATSGCGRHPAASTSSYRDEQISFQLPRQDISLDYCSYPLNELSRSTYLQFVDKRNSLALDVGVVVQVRPAHLLSGSQEGFRKPPLSGCPTPDRARAQQQRFRKSSTISQSAVTLLSLSQSQRDQLAGQQQVGGAGAQRCRRCLVRFEDQQLAVAAPNFIIGSALYRAQVATGAASASAGSELSERGAPQTGATNVALFHPSCFTCSTCKEFLVDLVYCLRDNKLYCLRHYGESLRPRCSWCQELIFSDEYLKAMNENFHIDHFLCRHCDSNLAGQRYVLKDEKPFCIQCYEANFANKCQDCHKPIGIDSRDLSYKQQHWHDTCFACNKCQQSLIDKPFGSKDDKVFCADCYDALFATRCDGCKNPFRAGSKKMEYRGKQWHDSCFCCCVCKNTIGSSSFIPKNEQIYCINCYEDKYATRCTKCKEVIVSGGVTFRNEPWHRECFNCCNCNKTLAGQRFTTRDESSSSVPSQQTSDRQAQQRSGQLHNAYCIDCYGELFAKKCYACSQAITGLGGTRFVTFEDRSWHNECFICNDCCGSLVGRGFITDGPDTILCGDCAKAKLA